MTEKIAELLHELAVRPFSEHAAFSLTNYTFWLIIGVALVLIFFVVGVAQGRSSCRTASETSPRRASSSCATASAST